MDLVYKRGMPTSQLYHLIQGCTKNKDLLTGRQVHRLMVSDGLESVAVLGDPLIRLFASCGTLLEANLVFCKVAEPSVYTWHAIISAHAMGGFSDRALNLYHQMQQAGLKPNKYIFSCILKACGSMGDLEQGKLIHSDIIKNALESDVITGSTLLDMYAKCGNLEEALRIFGKLPNQDVVSWGAMVAGYALHGLGLPAFELFQKMQQKGMKPTKVTYLSILKACGVIEGFVHGKLIHDQIIRNGLESDLFIGNALIDMYAKCGSLEEACKMFDKQRVRDVLSYGAMTTGYVQHGHGLAALELFGKMQLEGIYPNEVIFLCTLKACSSIGALDQGKILHEHIIKNGLGSDVVLGNTLIDMYSKCRSLEEARRVFDKLPNRDPVSWGAMSAGYIQCGHFLPVMELFAKMEQDGIKPDKVTFLAMLKACASTGSRIKGERTHDQIIRSGLELDAIVGSALVDMYAKCGNLNLAENVFHTLTHQDVVSWSAMIAGHVQHGHYVHALELFKRMQEVNIKPDKVTFLCSLKACCSIGTLNQGKLIHGEIIKRELESDVILGSTLIDMYAKCGNLMEACTVFEKLPHQDEVSWAAMIAGYAQHGKYRMAKQCLDGMLRSGLKPPATIYSSVLSACSQSGHVEEGHLCFSSMKEDHGMTPSIEHFNCMVDLLGRAGCLKEAQRVLQTMPFLPDVVGWTALLSACRTHGNMKLGGQCFNQIMQLDLKASFGHVLMSNIYADGDMWQDAQKMQELRKHSVAWKKPGRALIEVQNNMHEFTVGDKSHPETQGVYTNANRFARLVRQQGHVPELALAA